MIDSLFMCACVRSRSRIRMCLISLSTRYILIFFCIFIQGILLGFLRTSRWFLISGRLLRKSVRCDASLTAEAPGDMVFAMLRLGIICRADSNILHTLVVHLFGNILCPTCIVVNCVFLLS